MNDYLEWEVRCGNIKHGYKHPPLHKLCSIMCFDIKRAITLKLDPLKQELEGINEDINDCLRMQTYGNEFIDILIRKYNERADSLEKKIGFYNKLRKSIKKEYSHEEVREVFRKSYDISLIKTVEIERVLEMAGIEVNRGFFRRRNENTPSCYIYKNTNTFTDFGDGNKSGDVIDLYLEIYGGTFQQALKELSYLI